jgi:hypothetical protein
MARNAAPEKSRSAKHRYNLPGHGKTRRRMKHLPLPSGRWPSAIGPVSLNGCGR